MSGRLHCAKSSLSRRAYGYNDVLNKQGGAEYSDCNAINKEFDELQKNNFALLNIQEEHMNDWGIERIHVVSFK